MQTLIRQSDLLPQELHTRIGAPANESRHLIATINEDAVIDETIAQAVATLWEDHVKIYFWESSQRSHTQ